jgi:hypothetical protein
MIEARKLARIRTRVVGGYLRDLGYEPSNKEYLAKVGSQLRYVAFGAAKYGKAFQVTIALHFNFLPPFDFAVWPGAPVPAAMCSDLCAFNRVVRSPAGNQFYQYGETEAETAEMLLDIATRAAAGLDEIGAIGGDRQGLLDLVTPRVLADDLEVFRSVLRASTTEEQQRRSESMRIRQILPQWYPHVAPTAILLGYLARHYGREALIPAYVAVARDARLEPKHMPYVEELQGRGKT